MVSATALLVLLSRSTENSSLTRLLSVTHPPVSAISSVPGSCRCCAFFGHLSAQLIQTDSNLSDDSLHVCHLVVSSGETESFLPSVQQVAATSCATAEVGGVAAEVAAEEAKWKRGLKCEPTVGLGSLGDA